MKLKPSLGSRDMINALSNQSVLEIVTILLQTIEAEEEFFKDVALFLKQYMTSSQEFFQESLNDLRTLDFPDEEALFDASTNVDKLVSALEVLYSYNDRTVGFLRGAVVEKLTSQLISRRCLAGECFSNYHFENMYGKPVTGQIDVAVLSRLSDASFVEGYECKISPNGFVSEDRDNLCALVKAAHDEESHVHVGVVSFENEQYIETRLDHFNAPTYIEVYGLNSLIELCTIPDYIAPDESIDS